MSRHPAIAAMRYEHEHNAYHVRKDQVQEQQLDQLPVLLAIECLYKENL